MTPEYYKALLAAAVLRIQEEIKGLILGEVVPPSVSRFSELHLCIDANCLGGFCDDGEYLDHLIHELGGYDQFMDFVDDAQGAVDKWLQAGRPS